MVAGAAATNAGSDLVNAGNDLLALGAQIPMLFPAVAAGGPPGGPPAPVVLPAAILAMPAQLAAMQNQLTAIAARMSNGCYDHSELDGIEWPAGAGIPGHALPPVMPATWRAACALNVPAVDVILRAYGLPQRGNKKTKLKRLQCYIGLRLAANARA